MNNYTPDQYLAAGRRAEEQGRHEDAVRYYSYVAQAFPNGREAREAEGLLRQIERKRGGSPGGANGSADARHDYDRRPAGPETAAHRGGPAAASTGDAEMNAAAPEPAAARPATGYFLSRLVARAGVVIGAFAVVGGLGAVLTFLFLDTGLVVIFGGLILTIASIAALAQLDSADRARESVALLRQRNGA